MGRIHQAIRRAEKEARLLSQSVETKRQVARDLRMILTPQTPTDPPRMVEPLKVLPTPEMETRQVVDLVPSSKVVTVSAPKSFVAQQYSMLKKNLYQIKQKQDLSTLLVTSASPAEGKTLTAVNLAFAMAQDMDRRVLLVDGNLWQPQIQSLLGLSQQQGLIDYLKGKKSNEEIILRTRVSNLSLVCSGHDSQDRTELQNSQGIGDFLDYVKQRFDWVVLDSPPFLPLTNVDPISNLVDGILVVIKEATAALEVISQNVKALSGKKVIGCILNGVPSQVRKGSERGGSKSNKF
jgi:protein-tyrosine kinase